MTDARDRDALAPKGARQLDRRDVLKAGGLVGLTLASCRQETAPLFEQPIERTSVAPGLDDWRPAVCGQCAASCWVTVRTVDGLAKKIEGNRSSPYHRGGVCALGHSMLQESYNPDRLLEPLRRVGERGSAKLEPLPWPKAIEGVVEAFEKHAAAPGSGTAPIGIAIGPQRGPLERLWEHVAWRLGAPPVIRVESFDVAVERQAVARVFGWQSLPHYDIERSDYVLSLGAAWLDRWRSPVSMARALAEQRASRTGRSSKLVHAEARHSLTAASADQWLPLRPGSEGVLARALASVLLETASAAMRRAYENLFPAPPATAEQAAELCGLPLESVVRLAEELRTAERPVVIAGGMATHGTTGFSNTAAGLALNLLLDRVGAVGGVQESSRLDLGRSLPGAGTTESLSQLASRLNGEAEPPIELLIVSDADPLHLAPAGWQLQSALRRTPTVLSLSSFLDDTTLHADLILPLETDLERFCAVEPEPGSTRPGLGLVAPALRAAGESRHPGDILLELLEAMGPTAETADPVTEVSGYEDFVRELLERELTERLPEGTSFRSFYRQALEEGGFTTAEVIRPTSFSETLTGLPEVRAPEPTEGMTLLLFESLWGADGRGANRPWLQELPAPLATVMWNSWAELSIEDAHKLGIEVGDLVALETAQGKIEVPAVVSPAVRPGCVAVPLGRGHLEYGRFARGRGENAMTLVSGERRIEGTAATPVLAEPLLSVSRVGKATVAIYGRGLRQHERIPRGWAAAEKPPHGGGR